MKDDFNPNFIKVPDWETHYEELSEFERGRIIGQREGGWANRRIAGHMDRRNEAFRRCWQEWVDNGIFQRHAGPLWSSLEAHSQRYVNDILRTVLLPFLLQYAGLIFQHDNVKPHATRVAINFPTAYQTLPWPARSPDPTPIEHVWDMMGMRLYLPGNVVDLAG
ncbi:transposable element Tc1 transposase [Trichonephila clavipes]|nr:transposable element Tc1 transposase [Trichonephila clavipes]